MPVPNTPGQLRRCQCEHACHFDRRALLTPHGNPAHNYGVALPNVAPIQTTSGTFDVCPDCATGCYAALIKAPAVPQPLPTI